LTKGLKTVWAYHSVSFNAVQPFGGKIGGRVFLAKKKSEEEVEEDEEDWDEDEEWGEEDEEEEAEESDE
jgi:hypothetical protein